MIKEKSDKKNEKGIAVRKQSLKDFFSKKDIYNIPPYQRTYKWGEEEAKTFIDDLINFYNEYNINRDLKYFFGMILCEKTASGSRESETSDFYLIDGQQRIITFILLYKAIIDFKKESKLNFIEYQEKFQKDKKFILENKNKSFFKYIFGNEDYIDNNFSKNYEIIYKEIKKFTKSGIIEFEKIFEKIIFAIIENENNQKSEEIFENINSKGKNLSLSDLLKNKFLMINDILWKKSKIPGLEKTTELLENNENKIFKTFEKIEILQLKIIKKNKISDPYFLFFKKETEIIRSLMSSIFKISIKSEEENEQYKQIKNLIYENKYHENFEDFIDFIKKVEMKIINFEKINNLLLKENEASFYLHNIFSKSPSFHIIIPDIIVNILETKTNPEKEIKKIFSIIAKASIASNSFSGINLWDKISKSLKNLNDDSDIFEIMNNVIKNKKHEIDEYNNFINEFDFFSKDKGLIKSLLILIENQIRIEKKSKEKLNWEEMLGMYKNTKFNIDHIIPQNLDLNDKLWIEWIKENQDYVTILNKLGNLTLTTKELNNQLKNKHFIKRKPIYSNSTYFLNSELSKYEKFHIDDEYKERRELLKKYIIEILN